MKLLIWKQVRCYCKKNEIGGDFLVVHGLCLSCITGSPKTYDLFQEAEKYIRKYKSKHKKGELFKVTFFDGTKKHILTIDTKEKDEFEFVGNIQKGRSGLTLSMWYHKKGADKYKRYLQHSTDEEMVTEEVKPIFDTLLSILTFVCEKAGENWKDHFFMLTNPSYLAKEKAFLPSTVLVKTSNDPDPTLRNKNNKRLLFGFSSYNPLSQTIQSFFSNHKIRQDKNLKKLVDLFVLFTPYVSYVYHVNESQLEALCTFLKIQSVEELLQSSVSDPVNYFDMYFEIATESTKLYDGDNEIIRSCIKEI